MRSASEKLPIAIVFILLCGFFGAGCQSAPEKHYPIQAEVISSNPERQMITVKHGDIPGLMPAMTMSYMVADPKQIEKLGPGDKITADLVVSDSKGRLENIVLVSKGEGKPSPGTSATIARERRDRSGFCIFESGWQARPHQGLSRQDSPGDLHLYALPACPIIALA